MNEKIMKDSLTIFSPYEACIQYSHVTTNFSGIKKYLNRVDACSSLQALALIQKQKAG